LDYFIATKVSIERKDVLNIDEITKLQGLYKQMYKPAIDIYRKDTAERGKIKEKNEKNLIGLNF
jgi:Holliday junction resolvasome RuvABC ATP-dependent DNA helicase subunit